MKALEASYEVSLRIAKAGKPHTIGESLILPSATDMVRIMLGDKAAKQLEMIPLSNDTVSRRISDLSLNVKEQLVDKIRASKYFSIQLDETTDITNMAHLLTYIRFIDGETVKEEFLFCEPLPARTTSNEIFSKLDQFMKTNNIEWKKCVGVCSDGARSMTGKHSGVVAKIKEVAPDVKFVHCSIHREALATRNMPQPLKTVLNESVKIVNFIKARALNSRLFSVLCNEMGAEHDSLLLHTEVRWLSRGNVLSRLFELRSEVQVFLSDTSSDFNYFSDELWLVRLAYLADVFGRLNQLNKSLQGSRTSLFLVNDKIMALRKKLGFMIQEINTGNTSSFPWLDTFLTENEIILPTELAVNIKDHLGSLITDFKEYFPENLASEFWIRDPFSFEDTLPETLIPSEKDELIEISCDESLKQTFKRMDLTDFWLARRNEYPLIADKAVKFLMVFATTYLCECGFSSLVYIKNKYRNKLNVEPDLRLKLSQLKPDIKKLCLAKQAQPSH